MLYWIKTHHLLKRLFRHYIWDIPTKDKTIYLTFDDGPTPEITDWVLSQLETYNAKATFFCIGDNIRKHPEILQKVLQNGHAVGNHTYNHLNGWQTSFEEYLENTVLCEKLLREQSVVSRLFRPPYGKMKLAQSRQLRKLGYKIIMWDILSGDFDRTISPETCLQNVIKNINPGSIVIFHDSVKAFDNLKHALPETLRFLQQNGYKSEVIV